MHIPFLSRLACSQDKQSNRPAYKPTRKVTRRGILAVAAASLLVLAGCQNPFEAATSTQAASEQQAATADPVDVKVAALKGPTAMGMVQFMNQVDGNQISDNNFSFEILASPDEVTPKVAKGEVDIAAVPANLASVLYNKTQKNVQVIAINTLGVIYMVEHGNSINSVADLKGKTIYASGKGATPEYALRYILQQNGLDPDKDVTIEWKSEHAECVAALAADPAGIAMLPEPFVTTASTKDSTLRVALDLTKEWNTVSEKAGTGSALITGVVIVNKTFAEQNPQAVKSFLSHYKESIDYVNSNVSEAATLVEKYGIVPAAVAQKAIPNCNIVYIDGTAMKQKLSGYLQTLFDQNAAAVGGALPEDDFYFGTNS